MAVRTSPLTAVATVVLELGFVALLWLGSTLFLGGEVAATTLLLFLVIALNLYRPLQELLELSTYRHQQDRIAEQLGGVWDIEELHEPTEPTLISGTDVEFRDVRFSYNDDEALRGVSFRAESGKVTALVGPSGAGKSTVADLVARFWDVDSGSIRIGGADLREVTEDELRRTVTTVYQEVYLFPDTIRSNLTIGSPDATDEQVWSALESSQAADFVRELPDGLDAVLAEAGDDLSGGQRQRLSIARALLRDPDVLLLDEAVASIDPATERRIQVALSHLVAGRTVVVVAHRLDTIRGADRIVVLDSGGVDGVHARRTTRVECGVPASVECPRGCPRGHRLKMTVSTVPGFSTSDGGHGRVRTQSCSESVTRRSRREHASRRMPWRLPGRRSTRTPGR